MNRRGFLKGLAGLGIGLQTWAAGAGRDAFGAGRPEGPRLVPAAREPLSPGTAPLQPYPLLQTPDLPKLPYAIENGVKTFRLRAEPVRSWFVPGRDIDLWGYNGTAPGPTIEVNQGDRVRIHFENGLPEPTTVHWHGLEVPLNMDGVPAISQPLVMPGGTYTYEFTLHQEGTFFYHSHMPMQEMLGMIGLFVIHPQRPHGPPVQKDFGLILQEFAVLPSSTIPDTLAMEFNWLTINGKSGPATTPLIVRLGDRVRIRFVNMGMDHHPMHIHGHQFVMTGTEGGPVPQSAWYPQNTIIVGVAQARVIEFDAVYPGDWMLHCHLPHHMMNHMVSMVGPMHRAAQGTPRVPGYPQDMWMPMDEQYAKPENNGLAAGWSGAVMGMMNLIRVFPSERYEKMMDDIRQGRVDTPPKADHAHEEG